MKCHNKSFALFVSSIFGLALSGCSGEPTASDLEKAFKKPIETRKSKTLIHEVKKLGCSKAQGSGYLCDVEVDWSNPSFEPERQKRIWQWIAIKGSNGWEIRDP